MEEDEASLLVSLPACDQTMAQCPAFVALPSFPIAHFIIPSIIFHISHARYLSINLSSGGEEEEEGGEAMPPLTLLLRIELAFKHHRIQEEKGGKKKYTLQSAPAMQSSVARLPLLHIDVFKPASSYILFSYPRC